MSFQESLASMQSLIPEIIGFALIVFAIMGTRELFKETTTALKRRVKA